MKNTTPLSNAIDARNVIPKACVRLYSGNTPITDCNGKTDCDWFSGTLVGIDLDRNSTYYPFILTCAHTNKRKYISCSSLVGTNPECDLSKCQWSPSEPDNVIDFRLIRLGKKECEILHFAKFEFRRLEYNAVENGPFFIFGSCTTVTTTTTSRLVLPKGYPITKLVHPMALGVGPLEVEESADEHTFRLIGCNDKYDNVPGGKLPVHTSGMSGAAVWNKAKKIVGIQISDCNDANLHIRCMRLPERLEVSFKKKKPQE